jgi:hypothetical protein
MEVKTMGKNQKDLNEPGTSEICGDGSCGCGCGLPMETDKVLSQGKIQEIRSSSNEESSEVTGNPIKGKGVKR